MAEVGRGTRPLKREGVEREGRTPAILGCAAFLILLGVMFHNLIFRFNTHVAGHPDTDLWKHLWAIWWFGREFAGHLIYPYFNDLINFPDGREFYMLDPAGALLSIPFRAFLPFIPSFNLTILYIFCLNGITSFLLFKEISGKSEAGLSGCVIFTFSPFFFSFVNNGETEGLHGWAICLFFYSLIRALKYDHRGQFLLLAILLFLIPFSNWYYGMFTLLSLPFFLISGPFFPPFQGRGREYLKRISLLAIFPVLIIPCILLFMGTFKAEEVYDTRVGPHGRSVEKIVGNSLRMDNFLAIRYGEEGESAYRKSNFIGCLTFLLLASGVIAGGITMAPALFLPLILTLLLSFLLGIGPYIIPSMYEETLPFMHALSSSWPFTLDDRHILLMPYALLESLIPFFRNMRFPCKFFITMLIPVAAFSSFAVAMLLARIRGRPLRYALSLFIPAAVFLEYLIRSTIPFPIVVTDASGDPYLELLQTGRGDRAMIEFPGLTHQIENHRILLYFQVFHHLSTPHNPKMLPEDTGGAERILGIKTIGYMNSFDPDIDEFHRSEEPPPPGEEDVKRDRFILKRAGLRYITIHRGYYPPASVERMDSFMRSFSRPLHREGDDVYVYAIY